ncbi:uncharacterized protein LOC144586237 [Pogona vitticeps]
MRLWQQDDPTLQKILDEAQPTGSIMPGNTGFEIDEGLLYRVNQEGEKQLVVPIKWRKDILRIAHDIPTAGHLAVDKMSARITQRFWWPACNNDIQQFCKTCKECQMTQTKPRPGAPLMPMPLIDRPFDRIGVDIVGPLTKSAGGHTHILVLTDYATRYPEAIPLRSTSAKIIARELMQVFTRLGFPKEILTDQGSNFMSLTLKEMWKLLDVEPIHASVYHPQTNGLVERFNKTLKGMLRKLVIDKPRKWHLLVAPLMFAIREVPQASTGFSPFEMMYGWNPRGILDLIKEKWESGTDNSQMTVQHVLEMRAHLKKVAEMAKGHLEQAQAGQKKRYDAKLSPRSFVAGQKVLLLLPADNAKLFARWQGPYEVIRQVGKVDYEIKTPDKKKKTGIYHVNLLKEWHEREALWGESMEDDLGPESSLYQGERVEIPLGESLDGTQKAQIKEIEKEFQDVFSTKPGHTQMAEHCINTKEGMVVRSGSRNWPFHLKDVINKEVDEMLKLGIIEPSNSPWRSYPVVVPKPDGKVRLCIDFRKLNEVSKFDAYPMPRIEDLLEKLGGAKYLSSLDLTKGYWQIPVRAEDKEKTAFVTPKGLYQFMKMPFGLHGAGATFQRLMDRVLEPVSTFVGAYIDDILIFSKSWEEHIIHIKRVLEELKKAGLTVNPSKCKVAQEKVKFLGHVVSKGEIRPSEEKIDKLSDWHVPRTKKEVQQFLGLAGYYRQFVPNFSGIAAPLTDLTKKKVNKYIKWGKLEQEAFDRLKIILNELPKRYAPDFSLPFILQTDASDRGIGAVLAQEKSGIEYPIMYLSKKLSPREQKYAAIEKEALAVKWAILTLKYYLLGAPFTLVTDHAPLQWLNRMKDANPRLTRWYLSLQPYAFQVKYKKGVNHANADYFSRQGEGNMRGDEERTAHSSGGACEGVERESVPSAEKTEEKEDGKKEQLDSSESNKEEKKGLTGREGEVKVEVCLAEGEWEESEVTVGATRRLRSLLAVAKEATGRVGARRGGALQQLRGGRLQKYPRLVSSGLASPSTWERTSRSAVERSAAGAGKDEAGVGRRRSSGNRAVVAQAPRPQRPSRSLLRTTPSAHRLRRASGTELAKLPPGPGSALAGLTRWRRGKRGAGPSLPASDELGGEGCGGRGLPLIRE